MATPREELLRVTREVLAPLVLADGGRLYLVSAGDDHVSLHLAGRFAGCPGNTLAIRRIVEPAFQAVAPGARVTVTSGAIIPPGASAVSP